MKSRTLVLSALAAVVVIGWLVFVMRLEERGEHPVGPQEAVGRLWIQEPGAEAGYVGDAECRTCHPAQFATHSTSPHARTLRRLADGELLPEFASNGSVRDPIGGALLSTRQSDGKNYVVAEKDGKRQEAPVRWVFGTGTHARTYLGDGDPGFTEFRISYYPPTKEWNLTPGSGVMRAHSEPLGPHYTPTEAAACFGCHSTALIGTTKGLDLERSLLNVGCESCHSAGRAHVESARAAQAKGSASRESLVLPSRLPGLDEIRKCGACHRLPNPEGEDPMIESQLARFPGVALVRSRCFLETGGKLTCSTCHDPHQSLSHNQAAYDRTCRGCHTAPEGTACAAGKTSDCVSCHMPEQKVARELPLQFHNHWIRSRVPDEEALRTQFSRRLQGSRRSL